MKRIFRPRLIALIAATTALATLIPAGFAVGFHDTDDTVDFGNGVLQLHMVDGDSDEFRYGDAIQPISESRCEVSVDAGADLVTFEGTSDRGPGINDHGLGVKSGGAQGVACGRVDTTEELHVSLLHGASLPLDGLEVAEAHLDIEVKQSAEVIITTYFGSTELETFTLRTGDSIIDGEGSEPYDMEKAIVISTSDAPITNCRQRSDSGPDAGAADNCRWILEDVIPFDSFVMTAGLGEFSLEGGTDGTAAATPDIESEYGSDSLFFLTDIDGILDCGDMVSTGDGFTAPEGVFTRLLNVDGSDCIPKPYTLSSSFLLGEEGEEDDRNIVDFFPEGDQDAQYSARLTSLPYMAPTDQMLPTIEYDPDGEGTLPYRLMQWCQTAEITYVADDGGDLVQDLETGLIERLIGPADNLATSDPTDDTHPVLPSGETWCIADMETRVFNGSVDTLADGTKKDSNDPDYAGKLQTTWWVYGEDDPGFRFG